MTNESTILPPRRRLRRADGTDGGRPVEEPEEKVSIQRFTLVSRGAPPTGRKPARRSKLTTPPSLTAQLGDRIQVCRCSECPGAGGSRQRLCRRDTECHPEYGLLLSMINRFEAELPDRGDDANSLVTETCCREKSAYFILDPATSTTVGYVAAIVAANRKVLKATEMPSTPKIGMSPGKIGMSPGKVGMSPGKIGTNPGDIGDKDMLDNAPSILQIYIEPEFRRKGLATAALALLLRDHETVMVDDPTWPILQILEGLGYDPAGAVDGVDGRPMVRLVKEGVAIEV
eukprot:gnl/TRDRNA2_/TRDRNA2_53467_c0_seq1.p1 gnl/TRDRNA2_/TRDRNA2_53467_c0~~gnl/TRDRNA2_/TRDRNA2_53467_c0_seq1.p1  ORF type:complete len:335 (-),score=66.74 gnl/TRDRNA2_/TRDRNA2_53467_c0_seq1:102-962(-)